MNLQAQSSSHNPTDPLQQQDTYTDCHSNDVPVRTEVEQRERLQPPEWYCIGVATVTVLAFLMYLIDHSTSGVYQEDQGSQRPRETSPVPSPAEVRYAEIDAMGTEAIEPPKIPEHH
jgi:hypothetical protein